MAILKKGDLKISDLGVYLKELKKEGQSEAEASRRKEMMKIRDKQKRINKKKKFVSFKKSIKSTNLHVDWSNKKGHYSNF